MDTAPYINKYNPRGNDEKVKMASSTHHKACRRGQSWMTEGLQCKLNPQDVDSPASRALHTRQ